jgi:hypothetical protein
MARPFHEVLAELDYGSVLDTLSAKLASTVQAVDEHQKPGEVTFKLLLKPNGAGKMIVDAKITVKAPETAPDQSLFFARPDGSLTRTSPKQDKQDAAPAARALEAV